MEEKPKALNVKVPAPLFRKVKAHAATLGLTLQEFVPLALAAALKGGK